MIVALKSIHVIAIALWSAGLLSLPFLYRQRNGVEDKALHRIHAFTRRFYVVAVSPAAFLAIGSGTALIFYRETFTTWFSLKLLAVALMMVIHVMLGLRILSLFEEGKRYPGWLAATMTSLAAFVVTAILTLVLGKPDFVGQEPFRDLFKPGYLAEMAGGLISWMR
ncbi:MAG: CopD family protein [Devosia sp.]